MQELGRGREREQLISKPQEKNEGGKLPYLTFIVQGCQLYIVNILPSKTSFHCIKVVA